MAADQVFAALSDATRREVLELIGSHGEASATQLARELPVSRQAVNKHLASLAGAGLVADRRNGREVLYRLTPAADVRGDELDGRASAASGTAASRRCGATSAAEKPLLPPLNPVSIRR